MRRVRKVQGGGKGVDRGAEREKKRRRRRCRPRKAEEVRWAVMVMRPLTQGGVDSLFARVTRCLTVSANLVIKVRKRNTL